MNIFVRVKIFVHGKNVRNVEELNYRRIIMRETKIMNFDFYVGEGTHDFEAELRKKIEIRELNGWEVDEVKIIPNKKREDWYDIFLILKRG